LPATYDEWLARAREQSGRFWKKVVVTGESACWLWTAGKDKDGYGKFQITGRGPTKTSGPVQKHVRAHRLAWELRNGPVPSGMVLMHSCDNPACCNPSHLKPGTQGENRADNVAKNRDAFGERNGNSRLTVEQVLAIRKMHDEGGALSEIGSAFGITRSLAWLVIHKTWRRAVPRFPVDGLSVVHKDRQTTLFAETDQPAACGAKGE
jgi:hypothetical protein